METAEDTGETGSAGRGCGCGAGFAESGPEPRWRERGERPGNGRRVRGRAKLAGRLEWGTSVPCV